MRQGADFPFFFDWFWFLVFGVGFPFPCGRFFLSSFLSFCCALFFLCVPIHAPACLLLIHCIILLFPAMALLFFSSFSSFFFSLFSLHIPLLVYPAIRVQFILYYPKSPARTHARI